MTRSEFIEKLVYIDPTLTRKDAEKSLSIILDEITMALLKRNRVELRGFGVFEPRYRSGRNGRNPKTGESVKISTKYVPFFRAGKELRKGLMHNGL